MDKGLHAGKNKLIKEKRHDVYQEREKWPEPTLCTKCGALFVNGRWSWKKPSGKANETTCPACRRIADRYPAGHIEIKGSFFEEHRDEILHLVGNVEEKEKNRHPLERIMSMSDEKGCTLITTTGIHVARRIGEALLRSYKGDLSFQYPKSDKSIRVYWEREL